MGVLHDLYDEAGWPSTRRLVEGSFASHPTIGAMLKSTGLPYRPYVVHLTKRLVQLANESGATHDSDALLRRILELYRLASADRSIAEPTPSECSELGIVRGGPRAGARATEPESSPTEPGSGHGEDAAHVRGDEPNATIGNEVHNWESNGPHWNSPVPGDDMSAEKKGRQYLSIPFEIQWFRTSGCSSTLDPPVLH